MKRFVLLTVTAAFFLPSLAMAHTEAGASSGLAYGFGHPFGGLDHLLAMLAVGLWAAQIGGRAAWAIPSAFVVAMIGGGLLPHTGLSLPLTEVGIAASVLALGAFIACTVRLPMAINALIVGVFAIFHGFAHGAEMPATTGTLAYTIGFAVATAALHLSGFGIGYGVQKLRMQMATRVAGGAIALSGLYLLFA